MNIITTRPSLQIERCPYLGLHDDDSTALAYASSWNYCYHAAPPASVALEHQTETCLCASYTECPVLLSNTWGRLPRRLRGRANLPAQPDRRSPARTWLIVLAILMALLTLLYFLEKQFHLWEQLLHFI